MLNIFFPSYTSYLSLCIAVYHCFPLPSGQRPAHLGASYLPPPLPCSPGFSSLSRSSSESIFCFFTGFSDSPCMCLHRLPSFPLCFSDPVLKTNLILCCSLIRWIIEKEENSRKHLLLLYCLCQNL